jgi:hypothetical protein
MTDSEDWGLIFLGQEGRRLGPENAFPGTPIATQTVTYQGRDSPFADDSPFVSKDREGQKIGPIVGVHSKSCDESIKIYEGRNTYCEWQFVLRERGLGRGSTKPVLPGGPGGSDPKFPTKGPEGDDGGGDDDDSGDGPGEPPPPGYTPTYYR